MKEKILSLIFAVGLLLGIADGHFWESNEVIIKISICLVGVYAIWQLLRNDNKKKESEKKD